MQNVCQKKFNDKKSPQSLILCGFAGGVGESLPLNEMFTGIVKIDFYLQTMKFFYEKSEAIILLTSAFPKSDNAARRFACFSMTFSKRFRT